VGAGADRLNGGSGTDSFVFKALSDSTVAASGRDTNFDFTPRSDRIDLSTIDANTSIAGDQAFLFAGTAAFGGKKGELRYVRDVSDTYIYGDVNGDRKADLAIHLDDAVTLQKGYFVL
jgi:serralysin